MRLTTLIDTEMLASRLSDPQVAIVDCRYSVDDESWGEREYARHHIPRASFANIDYDLSGVKTGRNGRHPLPDPEGLAETLGRLGVGKDVQVVAYDQDAGMYASRLWWLLRWLGHEAVAVLDGGFAKWVAEQREVRPGDETPPHRVFSGTPHQGWTVDADEISHAMESHRWRLVDTRAPERYRGEFEPVDKVAGHIPGAVNYFYKWNIGKDGTFASPAEILEQVRRSIGEAPMDRVVCYCGSGVTACQNLLAFEHAGLPGARLYPGSWSEWSSDPARPIARGDRP